MRKIYSNVGKKIQALAKVCGIIGIILVVVGIIFVFEETLIGVSLGVSGIMLMLSSFPVYAFGQIAEDIHKIKSCVTETSGKIVNDLPEL